ncbi:MAG: galactose-1-phosphate uridylyltransferase [Acidobacteriota bacterium]|nr:galactose-1-phosphate uridylyltransferase [Acidobacteriota bacterium]
MSELRKDRVSGRWVIIASERSRRPNDFRRDSPASSAAHPNDCPFCEHQESKTPPEIFAVRKRNSRPDGPGWRVRVVPNMFPAMERNVKSPAGKKDGLFVRRDGHGSHEVVIETPAHNREMADLPVDHIADILRAYRERFRSLEDEFPRHSIQVFKNKGREAGASLAHPHSQILAVPAAPLRVMEEVQGSRRLFRSRGHCVFCLMIQKEGEAGERIVTENPHFRAIAPFASRFPFETAVYPLRHSAFFSQIEDDEIPALAGALKHILRKLQSALGDPSYNLVIHTAPNPMRKHAAGGVVDRSYHWHVEILPFGSRAAGFEWGTGLIINPVSPETAAEVLRADL